MTQNILIKKKNLKFIGEHPPGKPQQNSSLHHHRFGLN